MSGQSDCMYTVGVSLSTLKTTPTRFSASPCETAVCVHSTSHINKVELQHLSDDCVPKVTCGLCWESPLRDCAIGNMGTV